MKNVYEITDNNGDVWELVPTVRAGEKFITVSHGDSLDFYRLIPVKKPEKKEYYLSFGEDVLYDPDNPSNKSFRLTPTTAHKLSEAFSALVEYVQNRPPGGTADLTKAAIEARESYQNE